MNRIASMLLLVSIYLSMGSGGCGIDIGMKEDIENKVDQTLYRVDELNRTLQELPSQVGEEGRRTITQFQATATTLLETQTQLHKNAGNELIKNANTELNRTLSENLENANKVLDETISGVKEISQVTLDNMEEIATALGGTLDKNTDKVIFAGEKLTDDLQEIASQAGLTAKETTLLLTGELKLILENNMDLFDKILQARINQLFRESTKMLKEADKVMEARIVQLDSLLQGKIESVSWNALVIAENANDGIQATLGQATLMIFRFIVLGLGFVALIRLAFLIIKNKIRLTLLTILPILILMGIGSLFFSNELMFELIGKEFMTVEDFHKLSDEKYQKIQTVYEEGGLTDNEFCSLCEETIEIISKCQVLTAPDNRFRKVKYKNRMENIYFILSELETKCF